MANKKTQKNNNEKYTSSLDEIINLHARGVLEGDLTSLQSLYDCILMDLKDRVSLGCYRNTDKSLILLLENIKPSQTRKKNEYVTIFSDINQIQHYTLSAGYTKELHQKEYEPFSFSEAVRLYHKDLKQREPTNDTEKRFKILPFDEVYKTLKKQKSRYKY